jgi:hypothetical protein
VVIAGNTNRVTIEAVAEISATGNDLTISYKRGFGSAAPKIAKLGTNVSITKIEK